MNRPELAWVNSLKGLGIILVVLGHCFPPKSDLTNYLYSFHIALFIFISGYLLPEKLDDKELGYYFQRKFKRLMLPYFGYGLFSYLVWAFIGRKFGVDSLLDISVWKPLLGLFYGNGHNNFLIFNIALWFLPALFSTLMLYYIVTKYFPQKLRLTLVILLLVGIGYLDSIYGKMRLPWGINISFVAVAFIFLGHHSQKLLTAIDRLLTKGWKLVLAIILIIIGYLVQRVNEGVSFNSHSYANLLFFFLSALSSILGYLLITKEALVNKLLSYLGKISLKIFALHILAFSFISALMKFVFNLDFLLFKNSFSGRITYWLGSILIVVIYDLVLKQLQKRLNR